MITILLSFIKNKLFSSAGIFFLIFGLIIGTFLFFNSNVILSKFGFETTATLKSELTRSQADIEKLKAINEDLNKKLEDMKYKYEEQIRSITTLQKEKAAIEKKVTKTVKAYKDAQAKLNKNVEAKSQETQTELTIPIDEINQLSFNNIGALNSSYSKLFEIQKR